MAYNPKSKRSVIRDPQKARLFDNLTNNKNIEDIQALAGLNNGLADDVVELQKSKQDVLVSGVNIKTINSNSLLGSGDLIIGGGVSITYERKSNYVYPYQYSGTAPVGTLDSGTWTIKRVDFTTPGSPITLQATGAWTNRYSLTYV